MKFSSRVPAIKGGGALLIDYLVKRFTYHDRSTWIGLIADGRVTIEGHVACINDSVRGGDTVTYDPGDFEEPQADLDYSIIYEDEWLFAVNKPGNLLIHRAGRAFRNNLMYQLRFVHEPAYTTAHSIHRLDRNTSGVVLIARTPENQATMSELFRKRKIHKEYIALVHGTPSPEQWIINKPISCDPSSPIRSKFRVDSSGKEATSHILQCERVGTSYSRLLVAPLTGRTHQLRVHCASIGHPIAGDILYGSDINTKARELKDLHASSFDTTRQRHALHCIRITFHHPWSGKELLIEAPVPEDMIILEKLLEADKKKGLDAPIST